MQLPIAITLLLAGADLNLPSADVCERRLAAAIIHLDEMDRAYKIAGSYAMEQRYEVAKRTHEAWSLAFFLRTGTKPVGKLWLSNDQAVRYLWAVGRLRQLTH